jgi:hypothetical protein
VGFLLFSSALRTFLFFHISENPYLFFEADIIPKCTVFCLFIAHRLWWHNPTNTYRHDAVHNRSLIGNTADTTDSQLNWYHGNRRMHQDYLHFRVEDSQTHVCPGNRGETLLVNICLHVFDYSDWSSRCYTTYILVFHRGRVFFVYYVLYYWFWRLRVRKRSNGVRSKYLGRNINTIRDRLIHTFWTCSLGERH